MKSFIRFALILLPGLAQTSHAALISSAYRAIPCSEYAPGCPTEQRNLAPGATFDPFSWTNFWRARYPNSHDVGYMRALDSNSAGWIVGQVRTMNWDESVRGPWDGSPVPDIQGSTFFVYHPSRGVVCCTMDDPFWILAVDDDGYIYHNGFYGVGVLHTSTIDPFPRGLPLSTQGLALNVVAPFPGGWPPFFMALRGRDSSGVFHISDWSGVGPHYAAVPYEIPEPATALLSSWGITIVLLFRNRS